MSDNAVTVRERERERCKMCLNDNGDYGSAASFPSGADPDNCGTDSEHSEDSDADH